MRGAGNILRECRKHRGVTQRDLAKRSGVPTSTICNIEGGKVNPRYDTLELLLNSIGYELAARTKQRREI